MLFALFISSFSMRAQELAAYEGRQTANTTAATDIVATGLSRGSGINSTGSTTFNSNGWDASTAAQAVANDEYVQWSIEATAGNTVSVNQITISYDRSNSGPNQLEIRTSLDNYASPIFSDGAVNASGEDPTFSVTPVLNANSGTPITFRLYAWGATSGGGTFDIEDDQTTTTLAASQTGIILSGTVAATSADTSVEFSTDSVVVDEGDSSVNLTVDITNPSATNATTVDVVLISGNQNEVDNYITQTLTFPAGSTTAQNAVITITDDTDVEGLDTIEFELQNVSGGDNATIGARSDLQLDIEDNDGVANAAPVVTYVSDTSGGSTGVSATVDVEYTITDDNNNIQNPTLVWNFAPSNGASSPASGTVSLVNNTGNSYTGSIPGMSETGTVSFLAFASDEGGNVGQSSTQSYTVVTAAGGTLPVIINEVSQGTSGNKEWVELLVVEDNYDLRGFEVGDNDDGVQNPFFTFNNIAQWSSVSAGTIIVIYNAGDVDSVITPDFDFSDHSVTLPSNNTFYFNPAGWGRFSDSDRDDGPTIFNDMGMIVHDMAAAHPTPLIATPVAGNSKRYMAGDASQASLEVEANWSSISAFNASPGIGNGGDNTVYINTLRGRSTYVYASGVWSPVNPEGNSTADDVVIIQDGTYTATGDFDALDFIIENGATVDLGVNTLNLAGNLQERGVFNAQLGTINAAGTRRQFVEGNDFEVDTFILNNSAGLILNANLRIGATLRLQNGTLNIGDDIVTFLSGRDTSGQLKTAVLDEVGSGGINGTVRVQQFYPSNRAFRFGSSSVDMIGGLFSNWQQSGRNPGDAGYRADFGTQITGGSTANGFDQSGSNSPSAFTYNNTSQQWNAIAGTRGAGNGLSAGEPLRILIRGDRSVDLTASPSAAVATATTLESEGNLVIGAFQFPSAEVSMNGNAGGFSLIGNPYQAQVNMGQVLTDPSTTNMVTGSYVIWDPTAGTTNRPAGSGTTTGNGQYVTYDFSTGANTTGSDVNAFIQPSQAIFVQTQAAGSPTLQFRENYKTDDPFTTTIYDNSSVTSLNIRMYEDDELGTGLPARDGILMKFSNDFANQYVIGEDVVKFRNPGDNLSVDDNGTDVMLLSHSFPVNNEVLDLNISNLNDTNYTFEFDNDFQGNLEVYFIDSYTNERILLQTGLNQVARSFDPSDARSTQIDRFSIEFVDTTLSAGSDQGLVSVNAYPNPVSDVLTIDGLQGGMPLEVNLFNMTGQLVKSYSIENSLKRETLRGFDSLKYGLYLLTLKEGENTHTIQLAKE